MIKKVLKENEDEFEKRLNIAYDNGVIDGKQKTVFCKKVVVKEGKNKLQQSQKRLLGAVIEELKEFHTSSPKYRTKKNLINIIKKNL